MCCSDKRSVLRASGSANQNALKLMYYGVGAVSVRGPVTGLLYQFSRLHPVQSIDARDAVSILKTRLFRQTQ
jgi:hypothetical protein